MRSRRNFKWTPERADQLKAMVEANRHTCTGAEFDRKAAEFFGVSVACISSRRTDMNLRFDLKWRRFSSYPSGVKRKRPVVETERIQRMIALSERINLRRSA